MHLVTERRTKDRRPLRSDVTVLQLDVPAEGEYASVVVGGGVPTVGLTGGL